MSLEVGTSPGLSHDPLDTPVETGAFPDAGTLSSGQTVQFVRNKHSTLLKIATTTLDGAPYAFPMSDSMKKMAAHCSTSLKGVRLLSTVAATLPSVVQLLQSMGSIVASLNTCRVSGKWPTAEKMTAVAQKAFFTSGDIAYISAALHTFGVVAIPRLVPGLQVYASAIFGIRAFSNIHEAWNDASIGNTQRMLAVAKETSNVAIGILSVVALTQTAQAVSVALLALTLLWASIDIAQYLTRPAATPQAEQPPHSAKEPKIDVENLAEYLA